MKKMRPAPNRAAGSALAPTKVLLLLSAAVMGAHLLLLWSQQLESPGKPSPVNRPFLVSSVTLAAPNLTATPPTLSGAAAEPLKPNKRVSKALPSLTDGASLTSQAPSSEASASLFPVASAEPAVLDPAQADTQATTPNAARAEPSPPARVLVRTSPTLIPGSLRLKYILLGEVRRLNYSARAELLWLQDGKTYDARLEVAALLLGKRVQTSSGRITEQGLAPKRFSDKTRSEVAAHFERDKGQVIFSANTPPVDLQADAQDQLSIFIQLASLIAAEPERYPAGSVLEMQAVGARDADTWRFVVDGSEALSLPAGDLATLKITRWPRQTYDLRVELWLAPTLGYLPARIRLTQSNGDFIDQQLRSSETPQ
jgi:hypothetical protein